MLRVTQPATGVSLLQMDDGKVNAMGPDFVQAFPKAWADATGDGRAVVIAGNAKAFCAGLDLKRLPTLDAAELEAFARGFMTVFADVLAYERPVVAAVDGPAMAGGAILALCSDFRLVSANAKLGVTEVPVGIPFPPPVASLCRARLPPQEHAPAILTGAVRAGEECVRAGWAHRFCADPAKDAIALAAEMAQLHPPAFASGKRALSRALAEEFRAFVARDAGAWAKLAGSEETMQAVLSYFSRVTKK